MACMCTALQTLHCSRSTIFFVVFACTAHMMTNEAPAILHLPHNKLDPMGHGQPHKCT